MKTAEVSCFSFVVVVFFLRVRFMLCWSWISVNVCMHLAFFYCNFRSSFGFSRCFCCWCCRCRWFVVFTVVCITWINKKIQLHIIRTDSENTSRELEKEIIVQYDVRVKKRLKCSATFWGLFFQSIFSSICSIFVAVSSNRSDVCCAFSRCWIWSKWT